MPMGQFPLCAAVVLTSYARALYLVTGHIPCVLWYIVWRLAVLPLDLLD